MLKKRNIVSMLLYLWYICSLLGGLDMGFKIINGCGVWVCHNVDPLGY